MPNWTDLASKPDAWFDDICANCGQRRGMHTPDHPNITLSGCTGFVEPINLCCCGHTLISHVGPYGSCLTRDIHNKRCRCKGFRKLVTGIHDCANCGCNWDRHQSEEDPDSTACEKCGRSTCAHFVSSVVNRA